MKRIACLLEVSRVSSDPRRSRNVAVVTHEVHRFYRHLLSLPRVQSLPHLQVYANFEGEDKTNIEYTSEMNEELGFRKGWSRP